ncbi:hypothetical protein JGU66_30250 [Myxococcaceae bacterium JPH2]|nr:hypothetical protein [Myxococcaceae bacterium JPH2]
MSRRFLVLPAPFVLVSLLVWLTIGIELWSRPLFGTGLVAKSSLELVAAGLHAGLLVFFLAAVLIPSRAVARCGWMAGQALCVMGLLAVVRYNSAAVLLIIVAGQAAQWLERTWIAAALLAVNVAMYGVVRALWSDLPSPLLHVLLHASFQLFAVALIWFARSAEEARERLAHINADLLATRALLSDSARDAERLRMARELHDVAGHKLTALVLNLRAVAQDGPLDSRLVQAQTLTTELLTELRGVVQALRAERGFDLETAMHALAAPLPGTRLSLDLAPDLHIEDPRVAEALLRVVQEALTNSARHAEATCLSVGVSRDGSQVRLRIDDDGRVREPLKPGHGLQGMQERLRTLGGDLTTRITARGSLQLEGWLRG